MEQIRSYIIKVAAAAILYSIVMLLTDKKSIYRSMMNILCGMFMTVTVLSPLLEIQIDQIDWSKLTYLDEGQNIVSSAQKDTMQELALSIIGQTEAYILNKADVLNGEISAQVQLCDDDSFVPWSVKLEGEISPYGKRLLTDYIAQNLGIPEERQTWIS